MRVLFLDIDGVLNSEQWTNAFYRETKECIFVGPEHFCRVAISNLKTIIEAFDDLKIVVSSTWRLFHSLDELKGMFSVLGIDDTLFLGMTPSSNTGNRGAEIAEWLAGQPEVRNFAIVDDNSDMEPLMAHFVKINGRHGLMLEDAEKVIKILKADQC